MSYSSTVYFAPAPPAHHHRPPHHPHYAQSNNKAFLPTTYYQDPFSDPHHPSSIPRHRMPTTVPPPVPPRTEVRTKMARSNSSQLGSAPPPLPHRERPRRSLSEDSGHLANERSRDRAHQSKSKPATGYSKGTKLPNAHGDSIDMLDSATGGRFHHDGPFDAATPSRHRSKHRNHMSAFDGAASNLPAPHNVPVLDKRLSPLAQATIAAMASSSDGQGPYGAVGTGPIPTIGNAIPEAQPPPFLNQKKTTLAEAWGKAEPEPFEEFSAGVTVGRSPASSIDGGYEGFYNRRQEAKARQMHAHPENVQERRRSKLPPPQPINLPGSGGSLPNSPSSSPVTDSFSAGDLSTSPSNRPPVMKRTKSLMQRIRKMRDNPNVPIDPVNSGYATEPWTPGTPGVPEEDYHDVTPTQHTSHGRTQAVTYRTPTVRRSADDSRQAEKWYAAQEKALPPPPIPSTSPRDEASGYFDRPTGITRKTSLYQKVKGAVAGNSKTR